MEPHPLNNFDEMIEVLKAFSNKLDSLKNITDGLYSLDLYHNYNNYNLDLGKYKGQVFFVLIDLDVDSKYKYMCSVNNSRDFQYDTFELYNLEGDYPTIYVPFPDEFTQDSYFNLMTMHDTHNVPLELLQISHHIYTYIKGKF